MLRLTSSYVGSYSSCFVVAGSIRYESSAKDNFCSSITALHRAMTADPRKKLPLLAQQKLCGYRAVVVDRDRHQLPVVVVGSDNLPLPDDPPLLHTAQRHAQHPQRVQQLLDVEGDRK